jgi:hypothetical protein
MAVFGHSGSQAPQLMHSLVIIVAMTVQKYHRVRAPFKWPRWPPWRGDDREAR